MTGSTDMKDCQCEFEHEEMHECAVCGKCCFGDCMFKESHQTYEEKATCLECALKEDDSSYVPLEQVVKGLKEILNTTYHSKCSGGEK